MLGKAPGAGVVAYHGDRKDPSLVDTQYCYLETCQGQGMSTEGASRRVEAGEV